MTDSKHPIISARSSTRGRRAGVRAFAAVGVFCAVLVSAWNAGPGVALADELAVTPATVSPGGTVTATGVCPDDRNRWDLVYFWLAHPGGNLPDDSLAITPGVPWSVDIVVPTDFPIGPAAVGAQCWRSSGGGAGTEYVYFTVADTTPPTVEITDGPAAVTASTDATIVFGSDDPLASYDCALDGGAAVPCTSPFDAIGLPDGEHTFSVTARDPAGNVGGPATISWTIDTTTPSVIITNGPDTTTTATDATFTFTSEVEAAQRAGAELAALAFTCSLDGSAPTACASPASYTGLGLGPHTFEVEVANEAGATSRDTWSWTVVEAAPPASGAPPAPAAPTQTTEPAPATDPPSGSTPDAGAPVQSPVLPVTGATDRWVAATAASAVLVGALLVAVSRRRPAWRPSPTTTRRRGHDN